MFVVGWWADDRERTGRDGARDPQHHSGWSEGPASGRRVPEHEGSVTVPTETWDTLPRACPSLGGRGVYCGFDTLLWLAVHVADVSLSPVPTSSASS